MMGNKVYKFIILMELLPEFSPKFCIPENMWILVHSCTSIDKNIHTPDTNEKNEKCREKKQKGIFF